MSYKLELEALHKHNKQGQIDLIYINLNDALKKLKKYTEAINAFIGTFLSKTNTCDNMSCEYALEHGCISCPRYNLALTHISQRLQFIDELYIEEKPKLQEKINQRDKNQYTISLIEHILNIKFNGDINNNNDVQNFIKDNLHKILNDNTNKED